MYYDSTRGATMLPSKSVKGWFSSIFSMAFYVGLFSGIGYLLQVTLF